MKQYIIYNDNKGVIIPAEDMDQAYKKAHSAFYGAFSAMHVRDLTNGQMLEAGKNYPFNLENFNNKTFNRVQFHFSGSGCGVTTQYDKTISVKPTEDQLKFIGESSIDYVKFWNGKDLTKFKK